MTEQERLLVVVVTGLSGAGKSTAINALEDLGFFCVDNLPTPVVASTLEACAAGGMRRVALGIDVRVRSFLESAVRALGALPVADGCELQVLFLDASDEALLRRFSATRRPHPLTATGEEGAAAVLDGIRIERERLSPLRARATVVIDTTTCSVHDLRRQVTEAFSPQTGGQHGLRVRIVSFGFKYGTPVDADLVFDVRFLPNPFFVESLRAFSGLDAPVRDFVLGQPDTGQFLDRIVGLLEFCLPRFAHEGKAYLTVGVGCTGGRHRSVALAEQIGRRLQDGERLLEVTHRDIARVSQGPGGKNQGRGARASQPDTA